MRTALAPSTGFPGTDEDRDKRIDDELSQLSRSGADAQVAAVIKPRELENSVRQAEH